MAPWVGVLKELIPEIFHIDSSLEMISACSSATDIRHAIYHIFCNSREPKWIIKCHQDELPIEREYLSLKTLDAVPDVHVPLCIGKGRMENFYCILITYKRGMRPSNQLVIANSIVMENIVDTIANAQKSLECVIDTSFNEELLVIEDYLRLHANLTSTSSEILQDRLEHLKSSFTKFDKYVLPQHGDFVLGNLLYNKNKIVILDWETCGMVSIPFFDIWTLLLSVLDDFSIHSFKTLFQSSQYCRIAQSTLFNYAKIMSMPTHWGVELFPLILSRWIILSKELHRSKLESSLTVLLEYFLQHAFNFLPQD